MERTALEAGTECGDSRSGWTWRRAGGGRTAIPRIAAPGAQHLRGSPAARAVCQRTGGERRAAPRSSAVNPPQVRRRQTRANDANRKHASRTQRARTVLAEQRWRGPAGQFCRPASSAYGVRLLLHLHTDPVDDGNDVAVPRDHSWDRAAHGQTISCSHALGLIGKWHSRNSVRNAAAWTGVYHCAEDDQQPHPITS